VETDVYKTKITWKRIRKENFKAIIEKREGIWFFYNLSQYRAFHEKCTTLVSFFGLY
jgi:hypothetical protein